MELPGKKIQDNLERIKTNVENSRKYFEHNYKRFNKVKKFLFVSTLNSSDRSTLNEIGQPQIECNLLESFVSRLRGEFSKQEPSIQLVPDYNSSVDPQLIQVVEGHARAMECDERKAGIPYDIYTDMMCGFAVMKLWTEYENDNSFEQVIKSGRAFDPTLCGFDPLARESHKGDGRYAFELFPKTKDDFIAEYPDIDLKEIHFIRSLDGFSWSYATNHEDILLICDYYEKKKRKVKIVEISQTPAVQQHGIPKVMEMDKYKELLEKWDTLGIIEQPPVIAKSRYADKETIVRYRFIENKVLEYVETDFMGFPLIYAGGNEVLVTDNDEGSTKEYARSYIHNAIGTQKLANAAIQCAGNELENIVQHKFIVAKESIPEEYLDAYTDYQIPSVMVYNAFLDKEGVEPGSVALPPPREIQRMPMPPEILGILNLSFQLFQNILGSFDSSLGINNNQLSGVAIVEAATQSNAAAMPFVVGYIKALNRKISLWVDLFPRYYLSPRSIPVMSRDGKEDHIQINTPGGQSFKYGENDLKVKVEAGPNYAIQKSKTLQLITGLAQSMPSFAEFINSSSGLQIIINLLDLPGAEELKEEVKGYIEQKKQSQMQQQNQPNPLAMKMQIDQARLQMEQAKLQAENQQNEAKNKLTAAELILKKQELDAENRKINIDAELSHNEQLVQIDKHQAEKTKAFAEMAMKAADMSHSHSLDHHHLIHEKVKLAHEMNESTREETKEHI